MSWPNTWTEWVCAIELGLVLLVIVSHLMMKWTATYPWKSVPYPAQFRGAEWGLIHIGQFRRAGGRCTACALEAEFNTADTHPIHESMHTCVGGAS